MSDVCVIYVVVCGCGCVGVGVGGCAGVTTHKLCVLPGRALYV